LAFAPERRRNEGKMKLVRRISLFIICIGLFVIGGFVGFNSHEFFYPGERPQSMEKNTSVSDERTEVSMQPENIITADTSFVVIEVDVADQSESVEEIPVPPYYMGMDRETFEKQIKNQDSAPSLTELQKGFQGSEIRSFSGNQVELCKFYKKDKEEEEDDFFYLAIQENKVVVYKSDEKTIYMETDISAEELPQDVLQDLLQKRIVNTEEDLYDFLESYSS